MARPVVEAGRARGRGRQPRTARGVLGAERGVLGPAAAAVVAYLAIIVPYTARALRRRGPLVVVGRDGLEWTWNYAGGREVAYGLFVASACATAWAYFADPMPVVAAILLSFGASHLAYRDTAVVGSMWCFFAALFPIALLWRSE